MRYNMSMSKSKTTRTVRRQSSKPRLRLPTFKNLEEEAEFLKTHDLNTYLADLEVAPVALSQGLTVRFDPQVLKALRRVASERGIGPTTFIRMLVIDRLRNMGAL